MRMMTGCVAALIGVLALAQTADAQSENAIRPDNCTNRVLSGRYGFDILGTQFAPPPAIQAATVGVVEFDGRGGLSGSDVASFSGQIVPRTFKGTYSVNPNCTARATLTILTGFPIGATFNFALVTFNNGREARFIQTDPGSQFTGNAKRQ